MLVLQDCINKLTAFKESFGEQYGITKLGIFGSVARQDNTDGSDPWHAIYGLRNIISHEYANIDEVIVMSVINDDLPRLKEVIL